MQRQYLKSNIMYIYQQLERWQDAFDLLKNFAKEKEIFLVGGALRDGLLHLSLKDFDFAIRDSGVEFAKYFAKRLKGAFVMLDESLDMARVVIDKKINFDFNGMRDIEEDLRRRDFTVNAISLRFGEFEIYDPLNGVKDLDKGLIRVTGKGVFSDDPLRILRAFRFSATHGFRIERGTYNLILKEKERLKGCAPERIHEELKYIFNARFSFWVVDKMRRSGVLEIILSELKDLRGFPSGKPLRDLLWHSLYTLKAIEEVDLLHSDEIFWRYINDKFYLLKLSALLHDVAKPQCYCERDGEVHFYGHEKVGAQMVEEGLKERLRLSNKEVKVLSKLVLLHMRPHLLCAEVNPTDKALFRLVRDASEEAPGLLLLAYADALASLCDEDYLSNMKKLIERGSTIYKNMISPRFKRLITGNDLINLGLKPGPIFKRILEDVESKQISGELKKKEDALSYVKEKYLERGSNFGER